MEKAKLKIIVSGSGTSVGKTLVSSILVTALEADYWKPVESGIEEGSDTETLKYLISSKRSRVHPSAYGLKAALSPHHAARKEGVVIDSSSIVLPQTERPLVIETAGGILVPFSLCELALDLLQRWEGVWIIVVRHYLGSINHALLTLEILKYRGIKRCFLVFNGTPNVHSEEAILSFSHVPCLGRVSEEPTINPYIVQRYAIQWKSQLESLLL